MRLVTLIVGKKKKKKKRPEHSKFQKTKNLIFILKLVCFSGLLEHK